MDKNVEHGLHNIIFTMWPAAGGVKSKGVKCSMSLDDKLWARFVMLDDTEKVLGEKTRPIRFVLQHSRKETSGTG